MIADPVQLETLIRASGQDWMLDFWGDATSAAGELRRLLTLAYAAYAQKFTADPVPGSFDDAAILDEQKNNPHKVAAFLQAVGMSSSPEMLVMVWRILHGDTIKSALLNYSYEQAFELRVELENPLSGFSSKYASEDINDAALLRHWGIMKMGGRPIFDGFEPLAT